MKFLIDEDVPIRLIAALRLLGHDAIRVEKSTSDLSNAERSKKEGRVLISLDKDLTNRSMYPPKKYDIIHVHIHPPMADIVISAVKDLLEKVPPAKLKGLIILQKFGPAFFPE